MQSFGSEIDVDPLFVELEVRKFLVHFFDEDEDSSKRHSLIFVCNNDHLFEKLFKGSVILVALEGLKIELSVISDEHARFDDLDEDGCFIHGFAHD